MMLTLKRLSKQRPFVFFSAILLIYSILQLLISYHIIETELASTYTHHSKITVNNAQQQQQEDEDDKYYKSNTFSGCDAIPIEHEWGERFPQQRIACIVLSLYPRNKILMQFIGETYGKLCDGLFFILDGSDESLENNYFNKSIHSAANQEKYDSNGLEYDLNDKIINEETELTHLSEYFGGSIIKLNLSRPSHHTAQRNTWEKVHRMYSYFYIYYLHHFDWFVRIDDDVLISMVNLRKYLSFYNVRHSNNCYYIGHTLLDRWRGDNIVYNAGNLHVINGQTLAKLGPLLMTLPTAQKAHDAHAHCMDFVAGNDDPHLGACLNALGIYPVNTLDYELKNRFMVFRNSDHYKIKKEETWYWRERPFAMGSMKNCCNIFAMNDHPWIHISGHLEWRLKFTQMSRDKWNNEEYINKVEKEYISNGKLKEVIPPKPCSFMFNINAQNNAFNIDRYYNIDYDKIPHGQRLSFGDKNGDDILKCHKCKIGDENDMYWTNEWDKTLLVYKINETNKLKFYQISKYFPNQLISTRFHLDDAKKFISNDNDNTNYDPQKLQSLIDQALDPKVQKIVPP